MGTAYFNDDYEDERNGDLTIPEGRSYTYFNPSGDPLNAEVEAVRFRLHVDHNGGQAFDLGDVDMWIQSPDGELNRIYYNFDGFGRDKDDGNDSDRSNDYDISFWGDDLISSINFGLDGNRVNGSWALVVDNEVGHSLDLNYMEVWVDFNAPPELSIRDIDLAGVRSVGLPVIIETWVENTGDQRSDPFTLQYLVNGEEVGRSILPGGLGGNRVNYETDATVFDQGGANEVEVRILNAARDQDSSNNTRTETFEISDPRPDVVVGDVQIFSTWQPGSEVTVRSFIENQGDALWNPLVGPINVTYLLDGQAIGTDVLLGGLVPNIGWWEEFSFELPDGDPQTFTVELSGAELEHSTDNNTWSEQFHNDQFSGGDKDISNAAWEVEVGAFMARAVYGKDNIPEAYRDTDRANGIDDLYDDYLDQVGWQLVSPGALASRGYLTSEANKVDWGAGGLFRGDSPDELSLTQPFSAQGLLSLGTSPDGERTLALTFRGTDDQLIDALFGQAFTGNGQYHYYEAMRPLINAALAYANDPANGVEKLVVSGHSLGGTTADLFMLADAHRLDESVDLTVVSIASAGVHPDVLSDPYSAKGLQLQVDPRMVNTDGDGQITGLNAPGNYIGLSFTNDPVTFDQQNPTELPLSPNGALNDNLHFYNELTPVDLPNVSMTAQKEGGLLDQFGFGAEHNQGLYWAMLSGVTDDPLLDLWSGQPITVGETDYARTPDLDDKAFGVFGEFLTESGQTRTAEDPSLTGTAFADYIVALAGDDGLAGQAGDDLLSGGAGSDAIFGGDGNDMVSGGADDDVIDGGAGASDTAYYAGPQSRYTLEIAEGEATLTDRASGGDGQDTLSNVEFLSFDMGSETFNLASQTGIADLSVEEITIFVELYIAYFNRAPDAIGLNFWGSVYADGLTLEEIAADFLQQPETQETYPAGLSALEFATAVYNNVLGRTPDEGGLTFWANTLDSGGVTRDQFILEVLRGAKAEPAPGSDAEFIALQAADQAYLEAKTDVGMHFAVVHGMSDVDSAADVMTLFVRDQADSFDNAVSATDALYEDAIQVDSGAFLVQLTGVMDDIALV